MAELFQLNFQNLNKEEISDLNSQLQLEEEDCLKEDKIILEVATLSEEILDKGWT